MKLFLGILLTNFIVITTINAQIPTIYSHGGEGKNVNWSKIKAEEESSDGPGFFYHPCDMGITPYRASSVLPSQGRKNYKVNNLGDFNPMTAWVEADNGYGIGEYFEIQSYGLNVIYNGYQSSPSNWKANSRVQKFKVYRDGRPICYLVLTDEMGAQYFELPNFQYEEEESIWRFEIVDVFPGSKWADVAISEISNRGCCVASNTVIEGFNDVSIDQLSKGAEVDALDLNSGKSFKVKVNSVSKSIHLSLYRIETESSSLDLTHDHPIYIKGEEFISISQYIIKNKIDDLDALIGKIDFGIYDEKSSQIKFEKLKNIKIIEGFFETYTINQMAGGETFITNGFISKVY